MCGLDGLAVYYRLTPKCSRERLQIHRDPDQNKVINEKEWMIECSITDE